MLISTWLLPSSAYAPLIASSRATSTRLPTIVRIDEMRCSRHVFAVFATTENASGECIPVPGIILICLLHAPGRSMQQQLAGDSQAHPIKQRCTHIALTSSAWQPFMYAGGRRQPMRTESEYTCINVIMYTLCTGILHKIAMTATVDDVQRPCVSLYLDCVYRETINFAIQAIFCASVRSSYSTSCLLEPLLA